MLVVIAACQIWRVFCTNYVNEVTKNIDGQTRCSAVAEKPGDAPCNVCMYVVVWYTLV